VIAAFGIVGFIIMMVVSHTWPLGLIFSFTLNITGSVLILMLGGVYQGSPGIFPFCLLCPDP
jgi:hypothetical protein